MKTTQNTVSSPINNWNGVLMSLDWRNHRTHYENAQKMFREAIRLGVSQCRAFFVVANKIDQTGRNVDWHKLHKLWRGSWGDDNAQENGLGVTPPPVPTRPFNGHSAGQHERRHYSHSHHHRPKTFQRRPASLINYYV